MSLAEVSIRRPVLAIVMSVLIVLFGLVGFKFLGVREYPAVDPPVVTVTTNYGGASPEVVAPCFTIRGRLSFWNGAPSVLSRKFATYCAGPRRPWRRCASSEYCPIFLVGAPCQGRRLLAEIGSEFPGQDTSVGLKWRRRLCLRTGGTQAGPRVARPTGGDACPTRPRRRARN